MRRYILHRGYYRNIECPSFQVGNTENIWQRTLAFLSSNVVKSEICHTKMYRYEKYTSFLGYFSNIFVNVLKKKEGKGMPGCKGSSFWDYLFLSLFSGRWGNCLFCVEYDKHRFGKCHHGKLECGELNRHLSRLRCFLQRGGRRTIQI